MRLKHNKKRNTAFVYEALVRELTESVVKNNKNKQNKIVSIIKDHFGKESVLKEELDLYKSIYETRHIEKNTAEKIVVEAKNRYNSLNKKQIFQEQSALINKINRTLSNKVFTNFVPNFKSIASVYSIFQDALPVKDRVLLEENVVEQMSASVETKQEGQQPIDSLVYNTFVSKFNEEYSQSLNENQKHLLGHYVSSFADNGIELKVYLNDEIGRLKEELQDMKKEDPVKSDENLKEKVNQVYNILENSKNKEIDTETIEVVLKTQDLLKEMKSNEH
jgi:hypothetical protein|tara:strand:- start:407 stop:1237 length:831 start_codon:yes stop_codon:yes gene_type:complete